MRFNMTEVRICDLSYFGLVGRTGLEDRDVLTGASVMSNRHVFRAGPVLCEFNEQNINISETHVLVHWLLHEAATVPMNMVLE